MKQRRIIELLGSAVLIASMSITGCALTKVRADEIDDSDDTEIEEISEEDEEEDETDIDIEEDSDADEDELSYCCSVDYEFVSTNGELDGQLDYMTLCPDCSTINWEDMPCCFATDDFSSIDNEEIRALAEEYYARGFTIDDPELTQKYGFAVGDGEYMFTTGFNGEIETDDMLGFVYIYEMNETLFEYFMAPYYGLCFDSSDVTDDGTTIRIDYPGNSYTEFNRDTGIAICYYECENN